MVAVLLYVWTSTTYFATHVKLCKGQPGTSACCWACEETRANRLCAAATGRDAADSRCYFGTKAAKSFDGPFATCSQTGRTVQGSSRSSWKTDTADTRHVYYKWRNFRSYWILTKLTVFISFSCFCSHAHIHFLSHHSTAAISWLPLRHQFNSLLF